ncbi:MAG: isoaspartyl peptidase/L-asparaginase [Bacteroidetes bacterium]|nr:isoaspartyl peptidase/L-asparaginase [Bacteroidota bacterium]
MKKKIGIAMHGGAGTILKSLMSAEKEALYTSALKEAVLVGEAILLKHGLALEAVEAVVKQLEDNPLFNAGKGSVFTHEGRNEMDASIMDGKTLKAGAISGVYNVKNPITLARAVMEHTEHVFLSGGGAVNFAKEMGIPVESDDYFFVQYRYDQLQKARQADTVVLDHTSLKEIESKTDLEDKKFGTVGAVALDVYGNVAAATSTGGMTNKKHGRIGDSPIIGAGTYANNNTCAISCTGHGEFFMRAVVAYDISCLMEYKGLSLKAACDLVVHDKLVKIGGEGGLIAIDALGNIEMPYNTEGMYRACKRNDDDLVIGIY